MTETPKAPAILLVGATGAVGKQVLQLALASDAYKRVVVLTRRPIAALQGHSKAEEHIVDFDRLSSHKAAFEGVRDVFCGLGTTRKKAGSKAAFERVDYEYPLAVGELARAAGVKRYILISSVGASTKALGHYLKTKGRIEEALRALNFPSLHIMRPSLLLGERDEARPGEDLGKAFDRYLGFLIPKRYKGIHVTRIAERVIAIGEEDANGALQAIIWESEQIPLAGR